jgi:hypothetical protein
MNVLLVALAKRKVTVQKRNGPGRLRNPGRSTTEASRATFSVAVNPAVRGARP